MIPEWLITLTWFIAGILATGAFWYFLARSDKLGALWSAFGTVAIVCLAVTFHIHNRIAGGAVPTAAEPPRSAQLQSPDAPTASLAVPNPVKIVTLEELFHTDFETVLKSRRERTLSRNHEPFRIEEQLYMDFLARSKFVGFFIPRTSETVAIVGFLADNFELPFSMAAGAPSGGFVGEPTESKDLTFTGRVYIYHESPIDLQDLAALQKQYLSKGAEVQFRGPDYLALRLISANSSNRPN